MSGVTSVFKQWMSAAVCGAMLLQLVSCGTLLYPERRGQKSGEVDVAVVLMDAIGILFFVIPGLIAFAVDFHTGAIYLPPSQSRSKQRRGNLNSDFYPVVIEVDPRSLNAERVSEIVSRETGHEIRLNDSRLIVRPAKDPAEIATELKQLSHAAVQGAH